MRARRCLGQPERAISSLHLVHTSSEPLPSSGTTSKTVGGAASLERPDLKDSNSRTKNGQLRFASTHQCKYTSQPLDRLIEGSSHSSFNNVAPNRVEKCCTAFRKAQARDTARLFSKALEGKVIRVQTDGDTHVHLFTCVPYAQQYLGRFLEAEKKGR